MTTPTGTLTPDADLRKALFGSETMRHPAKQHLPQLMHLLRRFAVPGGVLLDPFGGAGSAMLACSPLYGGMHVVTVELARHFLAMQEAAWQHYQCTLEMQNVYGEVIPGEYVALHGDSRYLPDVLAAAWYAAMGYETDNVELADLIICSPSYGGSEAVDQRKKQNGTIAAHGGGNAAKAGYVGNTKAPLIPRLGAEYRTHGLSRNSQLSARMHDYNDQIVDLVVTSPPYSDALHHDQVGAAIKRIRAERGPYGNGQVSAPQTYGDLIITSPPYQDSPTDGNPKRTPEQVFRVPDTRDMSRQHAVMAYDVGHENIGNLRGDKYLASMRKVWLGAATVLKPGGILCCITRDCVRNGKIVPVGDQNRTLIEAAGLELLEVERWRVDRLSFWRILQKRKHPDSPVIDTEEVSIFRKPLTDEMTLSESEAA